MYPGADKEKKEVLLLLLEENELVIALSGWEANQDTIVSSSQGLFSDVIVAGDIWAWTRLESTMQSKLILEAGNPQKWNN